ncbi:nucleoside triphosphate pyrophosphohydrolase family protein [Micromonospora sp. WMMD718]|uniref:nucleoside triphosphate pyrophosphohydrolase family protein n=1 Tax=unclassified Micromonospora TaxID=2617518 RepID=UPI001F450271|nr:MULTISPECIES: nucleoside triphosphate pyrophosphohydrolase family protein [unclassified Micromonospora]MDG4750271.1 nucleoside triphosphate pyrophosphohydrolase family protein [Micromonospora sp. WMMD718]
MKAYQRSAIKTVQAPQTGENALAVALFGLAGETGTVLTHYKKHLRDGPADRAFRVRMREELGDVLWYVSAAAHHLGLDLEDIATANLSKITDRWRHTPAEAIPFDSGHDDHEQLPRRAQFVFTLTKGPNGRETSVLTLDGATVGDPITNASHIADGYCFHDIFHLAYAAVLGWSPVMRSLLKRKRRSNPETDEAEDGGRAIAIEEGISALVFSYASRHQYLDGKNHVDNDLLDVIHGMVAHLEVGAHRAADWEKAILTGFTAWRALRRLGGGTVHFDLDTQTLTVVEPEAPTTPSGDGPQARAFKDVVTRLHREKDAAYGNSWKRRGELISILANIARKVDRLPHVAATASSTADESALDTVIDLYVYALKYQTFLADTDPALFPEILPARPDGILWSDGPDGLERLLAAADLSFLDADEHQPIADLVDSIENTFAALDDCCANLDRMAPPPIRARHAGALADRSAHLIAALKVLHPNLFDQFVSAWQKRHSGPDGQDA